MEDFNNKIQKRCITPGCEKFGALIHKDKFYNKPTRYFDQCGDHLPHCKCGTKTVWEYKLCYSCDPDTS